MEPFSIDDHPKHIVVAEDEPNLSKSLEFLLNAAGYKVTMVPNGRKALAAIQNYLFEHTTIDLLITDIAMPEMDGEELICSLRKQSIKIPVLVITGYGNKNLLVRLMRNGCQDFIDKPFDPAQLEERVGLLLRNTWEDTLDKKRQEHQAFIGEKSQSIIHDLKNILGGTLGYAELAMEEIDKAHPAYRKMEKLFSTANLAAEICRKLLTTKPDAPVYIKSKTEINILVEKITVVLNSIAPDTIEIRTTATSDPVWLNADAERIQQALLNLGINAIDVLGSRGILTFATTVEDIFDSAGILQRCVCITVSDTGEGIPDEYLDKLFNTQFTTKTDGFGLGLPIVKRIVDEHSGRIEVHSSIGKGTQFKMIFPVRELT